MPPVPELTTYIPMRFDHAPRNKSSSPASYIPPSASANTANPSSNTVAAIASEATPTAVTGESETKINETEATDKKEVEQTPPVLSTLESHASFKTSTNLTVSTITSKEIGSQTPRAWIKTKRRISGFSSGKNIKTRISILQPLLAKSRSNDDKDDDHDNNSGGFKGIAVGKCRQE